MHQNSNTTRNDPEYDTIEKSAGRSPRFYWTSAALFAVAFASLMFSNWYTNQAINASEPVKKTVYSEDQGKALLHEAGGIVAKILVRDGQKVKAGDTLLILDGDRITAPRDGAIVGLKVKAPGDVINPGATVLVIVPMPVLALKT